MTLQLNGWTLTHDGSTWWALRDNDESCAAASYLEVARWAAANPLPEPTLAEAAERVRGIITDKKGGNAHPDGADLAALRVLLALADDWLADASMIEEPYV